MKLNCFYNLHTEATRFLCLHYANSINVKLYYFSLIKKKIGNAVASLSTERHAGHNKAT